MIYSKKDRTVDAPKGHLFSEFLEDKCPFLDLIPQKALNHWIMAGVFCNLRILSSKEEILFLCTEGRGRIIKSVF